jgi:Na+/melibiose symporter-like transporter
MLAYATGDGVTSLVLNSMGFVMLYYTEALGVDYRLAGLIISTSVFWSAAVEPVMGHVTDNTRSRYGRRHPYMLLGGLATVLCFLAIWIIPSGLRTSPLLFWYLIVIHLLLRTAITVFAIPHAALGFEVCTDYAQRTTLQGLRVGFNMLVNLAGPAMAWTIFLGGRLNADSIRVAANYVQMGAVFSIAALGLVVVVVFTTRRFMSDMRHLPRMSGNHPVDIVRNITAVLVDPCPRSVFIFTAVVFVGMSLVASLEMYVYVHVMKFSPSERAFVHGAGVLACGLGGLLSPSLVRRFDKKVSIGLAVGILSAANLMLAVLFVPGWVVPGTNCCVFDAIGAAGGTTVPVALLLFTLFHALYWAGNGILTPVAGSMIADASEVSRWRTGALKDGSYSAAHSCITKLGMSLGLLLSGLSLEWAGFLVDETVQTPQALRSLAVVTFVGGAVLALAAMLTLLKYPVTREFLAQLRAQRIPVDATSSVASS